jgi:hypothetical protein
MDMTVFMKKQEVGQLGLQAKFPTPDLKEVSFLPHASSPSHVTRRIGSFQTLRDTC